MHFLSLTEDEVSFIVVVAVLGLVVLLANFAEKRRILLIPLRVSLVGLDITFVVLFGISPLDNGGSALTLLLALAVAVLALSLLFKPIRYLLIPLFPRADKTAAISGYDPDSAIQTTALNLAVLYIGYNLLRLVLAGGMAGLAQDFSSPSTGELLLQAGLFITFAAVGVGIITRRNPRDLLRRLGLRAPTPTEIGVGIVMAVVLLGVAFILGIIWASFTPEDVIKQQTQLSEALDQSITSLFYSFLVAATAAIGEEILFRGALQPIFGIWPTSILFALAHIQYLLTPASLIIVAVGLGLGWVRRRYNTTTSMVTHFVYDYTQLALLLFSRLAV